MVSQSQFQMTKVTKWPLVTKKTSVSIMPFYSRVYKMHSIGRLRSNLRNSQRSKIAQVKQSRCRSAINSTIYFQQFSNNQSLVNLFWKVKFHKSQSSDHLYWKLRVLLLIRAKSLCSQKDSQALMIPKKMWVSRNLLLLATKKSQTKDLDLSQIFLKKLKCCKRQRRNQNKLLYKRCLSVGSKTQLNLWIRKDRCKVKLRKMCLMIQCFTFKMNQIFIQPGIRSSMVRYLIINMMKMVIGITLLRQLG